MIFIDEATSRQLLTINDAIGAVEQAFISVHRGDGKVFPVAQGLGGATGSSFSMKGGLVPSLEAVGLKVGSYWPTNAQSGLANHSSSVLLLDPKTGYPFAFVETSYLNALRTAAADALAVQHLARTDVASLGLVGAGHQAWFECMAVRQVRPVRYVSVWSRNTENAKRLAQRLRDSEGLEAAACSLEEVCHSDIIVTATASREPLIKPEWLRPGTHVSAMGADAVGKREIGRPYPGTARLFADLAAQARVIGEFQGLDSAISDLGAVLVGAEAGRLTQHEITLFDSSGLATQDLAIASLALRHAEVRRSGSSAVPG